MADLLLPPPEVRGFTGRRLHVPDQYAANWMLAHFADPAGAFHDPAHLHLLQVRLAVAWTNHPFPVPGSNGEMAYGGMAEMPSQTLKGKRWHKARQAEQLQDWFPWFDYEDELDVPDFLITLYAPGFGQSHAQGMRTVDHELFHCGHKGAPQDPQFNGQTGAPILCIKPHPVEVFPQEWERWGVTDQERELFRRLLDEEPKMKRALDGFACGTCLRAA